MYDELILRLKDAAKMSDALAVLLPHGEGNATAKLYREAADAIEERCQQVDKFAEEAARLYAKLPRWIPVSERRPEKSGDYLVFDDCRNLYVNEWHCLLKKWQYDDSRITHWMPLPEPPKEE